LNWAKQIVVRRSQAATLDQLADLLRMQLPRPALQALAGADALRSLFLLCHKMRRRVLRWQQGHLWMVRAMARAMATRTDVMELGT
jgi:hypothetical protein